MEQQKDRRKNRIPLTNNERARRFREKKMAENGGRKRPFRNRVIRTDAEIFEIAAKYTRLIDFRKEQPTIYATAMRRGLSNRFDWLKRGGDAFRWTKDMCEAESHKYEGMGRSAFRDGNKGAYYAAIHKGWIDEFTWLGTKQNPHTDSIYCVYRYVFEKQHAVYVGLTMNKAQRDHSHRTAPYGKKSAVLKYAESHCCEVPKMEVLQDGMSCEQAQQKEADFTGFYRIEGWNVLNKAKVGVGVGSIGSTAFKWTKQKVFEEAAKYGRRKHFENGCQSAYEVARQNCWLDEMTWMPNPKTVEKKEKPQKKKRENPSFSDEEISKNISDGMTFAQFSFAHPDMAKFIKSKLIVKKYFGAKKVVAFGADGVAFVFPSAKIAAKVFGIKEELINKVAGRRNGKQTGGGWVFRHFGDIEPWEEMRVIFSTSHYEKVRATLLKRYHG